MNRKKQQVPPLRCAPVGMTNFLQETASKAVGRRVVNGPTELSSRPERSVVEGPAVSLPVLTDAEGLGCRGSHLALFEAQSIEGAAQLGAESFHCQLVVGAVG
jgi:hypothetical protein